MTPSETLRKARQMGIQLSSLGDRLHYEAPPGVIDSGILELLSQQKQEILLLLSQVPDFQATACQCLVPIGATGSERCGVCGLPLICLACSMCRGCKLALKFKR